MPITVTVTNRWWPTLDARALDLLEQGEQLTDAERAQAEYERAARARRLVSPPFIRRAEIALQPSSHRGVYIGSIVSPHMGLETHMLAAEMHHLPPGIHTERHRHGERLMHVMTGYGHSVIDGERYDWEPGDSLHIKTGVWHQHFVDDAEPANFFVASASPLLEKLVPFPLIYKGDSYSDVADDFQPEHPFGLGPQEVVQVDPNEKWNSSVHLNRAARGAALEKQSREARTHLKWNMAKIERSQHKGDFKVALIEPVLGFDTRLITMSIHQMPPASYTETHKHQEAIVWIRTGRGYSIIEGERYDWEAGDCMHIQPGVWHQHFNTDPEHVSQHIAIQPTPLLEQISGFPGLEVDEDESAGAVPPDYEPKLPWQFAYTVPWPRRV